MEHTEILIVGAGVVGSAIAYHLALDGRRVLVVDRAGVAEAPTASWASAGGVRRQGGDPAEAALASAAIARWPTLEQELQTDLHYRQGGNLLLAEHEPESHQPVRSGAGGGVHLGAELGAKHPHWRVGSRDRPRPDHNGR